MVCLVPEMKLRLQVGQVLQRASLLVEPLRPYQAKGSEIQRTRLGTGSPSE